MGKTTFAKGFSKEIIEKKELKKTRIEGNTYNEIAESIGKFNKTSYISKPESMKQLEKNHNLRSIFLSMVGEGEPLMVGDFKNQISLGKTSRYALFHKLREMCLVKNISILNALMVGSSYSDEKDFIKDDLKKFKPEEIRIVIEKFRKWTSGVRSDKQRQNYLAGTFYWAVTDKSKDLKFLKWVSEVESRYREQDEEKTAQNG